MQRRTVIRSAGAAVLATGAAAAAYPWARAGAATQPTGTPVRQLLARPRLATDRLLVNRTAVPVAFLAVTWPRDAAGRPAVRVPTDSGWRTAATAQLCGGGSDDTASPTGLLLRTPDVDSYEVVPARTVARTAVTELNATAGPVTGTTTAPAADTPIDGTVAGVRYRNRAAWGSDESLRFDAAGAERYPQAYYPVQTLTVHHTGNPNDNGLTDPAAFVRALYRFQTIDQNYGDIGYHLLIDEQGTVYEGRYSGADPVPVFGPDLGEDGRPLMSNAAHVGGFNIGNVGVALIGDYTARTPTDATRRSLTLVLAALAGVCRLDPLGRTRYTNPVNGNTRTIPVIAGHRDWSLPDGEGGAATGPTQCPGNTFAPLLDEVRQEVAGLLGAR